jgi:hypothetical protein
MLGFARTKSPKGAFMRFYTKQHKHYCGIDLHAKKMFLCILDASGQYEVELAGGKLSSKRTERPWR